jgi:hypothetical protein
MLTELCIPIQKILAPSLNLFKVESLLREHLHLSIKSNKKALAAVKVKVGAVSRAEAPSFVIMHSSVLCKNNRGFGTSAVTLAAHKRIKRDGWPTAQSCARIRRSFREPLFMVAPLRRPVSLFSFQSQPSWKLLAGGLYEPTGNKLSSETHEIWFVPEF